MRRLKKYTDFRLNENNSFPTDREEIIGHLKIISPKLNIENATINSDGTVDIEGDLWIEYQLTKLPIKFGKVSGYFLCKDSGLTTLEGCPSIVGTYFSAPRNQLTNLNGFPNSVGGFIDLSYNQLTSLVGLPEVVGELWIDTNELDSWEGCPRIVNRSLSASENNFSNLDGCPQEIGHDFVLSDNRNLTSIEGLPKILRNVDLIGLPKLFVMDKYEGSGTARFSYHTGRNGNGIGVPEARDHPTAIEQVRQLFDTFEDFNNSLDYKYFKMVGGKPAIVAWKFEEALKELDLPFPKNPSFWKNSDPYMEDFGVYIYVDDSNKHLSDLEGVTPWSVEDDEDDSEYED